MIAFLFFLFGASVGSFLNVVIYRLPAGKSLIHPGSFCPECSQKIKWYDNIPIISYIILNGRCRECGSNIPVRYLVVESITAFIYLYGYLRYGISLELLTFLTMVTILIPIALIDYSEMLIPDSLSITGIIIGLILSAFRGVIISSILGMVLGAAFIYVLLKIGKIIYKKDVMGFGDVKLAAMLGAFVGWQNFLITIMLSALLGSVYGAIQIKRGEATTKSLIPYGPFLAIAGVISFIYGRWIIDRIFMV